MMWTIQNLTSIKSIFKVIIVSEGCILKFKKQMHTPIQKLDYLEIAVGIGEWIERNYRYFVSKDTSNIEIAKDFAMQLERLPIGAMSYIQQAKNSIIDAGNTYPPLPVDFIKELKILFNRNKKVTQPVYVDKIKFIAETIYKINGDENKINFIKTLHNKGKLRLKEKSIASLEIEKVLKRNNFDDEKIREIIGS